MLKSRDNKVTYSRVFSRWLPLAISWSLMTFELPLVQSIVSDLSDSKINLAALAITFAICLMCESPILMLVSASAALVKDFESFRKLRIFSLILSFIMSAIFLIITLIFHYSGLFLIISNQDALLADRVFQASLLSVPIPFVVGSRRFYQGVLIRSAKSVLLTFGTFTRLLLIFIVGILLSKYSSLHGALVGAAAGLSGMMVESLLVTLMSKRTIRALRAGNQQSEPLTYRDIIRFFTPLGISGVVNLSILPVLTFFMSQSVEPVSSLAGYQVLQGVLFFLSALALGLQEVIVSMLGEKFEGYRILRNFAFFLSIFVGVAFSAYVFTPLSAWILLGIVGIPESLYLFMKSSFWIALPTPILTVYSVSLRAVIVSVKKTRWVTLAALVELVVVLLSMFLLHYGSLSGFANAMISLLIARIASLLVFTRIFLRLRKSF